MDLGLADRRFLVGGASRGLGAAVAGALLAEGARVAGMSRSGTAAAGVMPLAVDLGSIDGASAAVRDAVEQLGGLDGLVVNSGGPAARSTRSTMTPGSGRSQGRCRARSG
jgi:NAD(P)-dependent dehydrogenase (short-subunit alcohol dehydrogenase family)